MCVCNTLYPLRDVHDLTAQERNAVIAILAKVLRTLGPLDSEPMAKDAAEDLALKLLWGTDEGDLRVVLTFEHHGFYVSLEAWVTEIDPKFGATQDARRKIVLPPDVISLELQKKILTATSMKMQFINAQARRYL